MDSMDSPKEETSKVAETGADVKIVTINGKQVEVKYEYRRKRVDIFGLHSGKGKNGNENRRPKSYHRSDNFRPNDDIRNIGNRRQSNERHIIGIENNISTTSIDSKESSINESVKSVSKVNKLMRRLETGEAFKKKSRSIERVANKLKKDKEPVKMTNRFDRLLSSANTDDINVGSVTTSAKNKRKKKNKSTVDSFVVRTDQYSNDIENQSPITAQNDSEVLSSDSVPEMIDSNDYNRKSDILFEANNNNNNNFNNYFEKSDDKLIKLNENIGDDPKAQHIKVYKNPIRENNNLLINEFIDTKMEVSKRHQLYDMPTPEKISETIKTCDIEDIKVQKNVSTKAQNNPPNGVLTHRNKSNKDNKSKTKSNQLGQLVTEKTNVLVVDQKLSALKWLLIIVVFVAFLVIYTSIILSRFCNCS